ncbi:WAP four-disulfide core domain protein 8-like [Petaurus breviceps papuanus]|uniref:WAP four-disulfide core domain protein 8-like n=1 Tax=Petaurus breviceps papuanus TaxID=3040969 RepID=UPI0036DA629F
MGFAALNEGKNESRMCGLGDAPTARVLGLDCLFMKGGQQLVFVMNPRLTFQIVPWTSGLQITCRQAWTSFIMLFWLPHAMTVGIWGNRAKSPSCTWLWRSIITIILILILSSELMPGLAFKRPSKPNQKAGKCPKQNVTCDFIEKKHCHTDFNCNGNMKCCFYNCGEKCLDPKTEVCELSPEVGDCDNFCLSWFYSMEARTCKYFFYSGCKGNANRFPNKKICEETCGGTVRQGLCPPFPFKGIRNCSAPCHKDNDCPETYKCCDSSCGLVCTAPWKVKPWDCPPQPYSCNTIEKPKCQKDEDCGQDEKCCPNCGLMCIKS